MKTAVLIPAAGLGNRLGRESRKAFLALAGQPLLSYSLKAFSSFPDLEPILIGLHADDLELGEELISSLGLEEKARIIIGGEERSDTVRNLIQALDQFEVEIVLIHDAARPLVSKKLIERVIKALATNSTVIPGIESRDTIKVCNEKGLVIQTPDRKKLRCIQTPQGFHLSLLRNAIDLSGKEKYTDEASILERAGYEVFIIPGEQNNFKITYPEDLKYAEWLIIHQNEINAR